jgi:hypothetical protein
MFSVKWLPNAESTLAELWNNASNRAQIAAAADELDKALARNPLIVGESRGENTRIAFLEPLAVLFDVNESARTVKVWKIWKWPTEG